MARAVPPGGYLLTGAARSDSRPEDGVWNSLLAIDGTAQTGTMLVSKESKLRPSG